MSGKKTKLKKIKLTSVDMVPRGANQEAFINLYKSEGEPPNLETQPNAPESPNPGEIPQGLWKSIVEAVKGFMGQTEAQEAITKEQDDQTEEVEKTADTFADRIAQAEIRDNRWKFQDALNMSIESILNDSDLSDDDKAEMMNTSIDQFAAAYKELCVQLLNKKAAVTNNTALTPAVVGKSQDPDPEPEQDPDNNKEGEEDMRIDKSRFNEQQLAQYEELLAIGKIDDDADEKPEKKEKEEKEAEMHPEVKKALDEMKELKKGLEMKELTDIAKKYAPLGKKENELSETLYEMKKSSQASYDAYLAVLDQNLELVNKSGIFTEIGKSSRGESGDVESKIQGIAKGYMDKDPNMDYDTAIMKAWENNPELMAAYDAEY